MGANHSELPIVACDIESIPCREAGGNVLFRTFGKQFGFIYTDGKRVYVRPINEDGLASKHYVLHEEEDSIIDQPSWGVSGKDAQSCYCCWRVKRSRFFVDFFLLSRKDTGEVAARYVGSIKSAPVLNNGIVWMEIAPITTVAVVEERKMTMYRVLSNSVESQKSFVLERSKPPFIGAFWADLSGALIVYNRNTLYFFKPTVNDKFCLLKSVDWGITFSLDEVLAEQWICTAMLIRSTNYILLLSEPKGKQKGKAIRETDETVASQEDDGMYTELLYVSVSNIEDCVGRLQLISYDKAKQTVQKLASVDVSRISSPDILCLTPYSGLVAVGGNNSDWVLIFGIDESYCFVLIDELRFNDAVVKGMSNYVLKPPQKGNYRDSKQMQSYLVVYTCSSQSPGSAAKSICRIAALRWPLQIDLRSGMCETEVKQLSTDGEISMRKVKLLNPTVIQKESTTLDTNTYTATEQLRSRSSRGASVRVRKSQKNEDWHQRNSTLSSKNSEDCTFMKPWRRASKQHSECDTTVSVLDHDGCASSCVDLLFIEPERVCELNRICSESAEVNKADLMAKVNQYDLRQREAGRQPLYRVERFALDDCNSVGFDLLLSLFDIRDVAVLRCDTGSQRPGSFPIWLEANASGSLPLMLRNNDFYFITGHATDLCKHVIDKS